MPPELLSRLGLKLKLLRRDPHYFLPLLRDGYLLFGSDRAAFEEQMRRRFSAADLAAHDALQAEIAALRADLSPSWLAEPLSVEETAERHVRPALRAACIASCRGSVGDYLERFGFESSLLKAMYAVTDGFSGSSGGYRTPGSGHNFLVHNMCRLPGADGTWMMVEGGMGRVTQELATLAAAARCGCETAARVAAIEASGQQVSRVHLSDGRSLARAWSWSTPILSVCATSSGPSTSMPPSTRASTRTNDPAPRSSSTSRSKSCRASAVSSGR